MLAFIVTPITSFVHASRARKLGLPTKKYWAPTVVLYGLIVVGVVIGLAVGSSRGSSNNTPRSLSQSYYNQFGNSAPTPTVGGAGASSSPLSQAPPSTVAPAAVDPADTNQGDSPTKVTDYLLNDLRQKFFDGTNLNTAYLDELYPAGLDDPLGQKDATLWNADRTITHIVSSNFRFSNVKAGQSFNAVVTITVSSLTDQSKAFAPADVQLTFLWSANLDPNKVDIGPGPAHWVISAYHPLSQ